MREKESARERMGDGRIRGGEEEENREKEYEGVRKRKEKMIKRSNAKHFLLLSK